MDELRAQNTLASIALDSLKLDTIVDDSNTNIRYLANVNMESAFVEIINKITENNIEYAKNKIVLYEAMGYEKDPVVLMESFADYHVQASDILNKFLTFMKNKVDAFNISIEQFIESNKEINSMKSKLFDVKHYEDDNMEGYNYTISENFPNLTALDRFNASLFDGIVTSITDFSVESIQKIISNFDTDQEYSKFRAELLNLPDENISEYDFGKAVYRILRDGRDGCIELNLDTEDFKTVVDRWFSYNDIKSGLNSQIKMLDRICQNILDKIAKITENNNGMTLAAFTKLLPGDLRVEKIEGQDVDTEGFKMSPTMTLQIDMYCKMKLDQLQKYTDYIAIAIGAKLDAIKAQNNQDREILLDAIHMISHEDAYGVDLFNKPKKSDAPITTDDTEKINPQEV